MSSIVVPDIHPPLVSGQLKGPFDNISVKGLPLAQGATLERLEFETLLEVSPATIVLNPKGKCGS